MPELSEAEFQREAQEIWGRGCYCHVGSFVDSLLKYDEDFSSDHFEALQEALRLEAESELPEDQFLDDDGDVDEYERDKAIDEWMDNNPREPMEYYSVDRWMADKLKEQHQAVVEFGNHYIWIRCATGQATYMDECVRAIAKEVLAARGA